MSDDVHCFEAATIVKCVRYLSRGRAPRVEQDRPDPWPQIAEYCAEIGNRRIDEKELWWRREMTVSNDLRLGAPAGRHMGVGASFCAVVYGARLTAGNIHAEATYHLNHRHSLHRRKFSAILKEYRTEKPFAFKNANTNPTKTGEP